MAKKDDSEKDIEKLLTKRVQKAGGLSIKLLAGFIAGLPDRMSLLPGGVVFFTEVKSRGYKPSKIQLYMHAKIRKLGFGVYVVDTHDKLESLLKVYAI